MNYENLKSLLNQESFPREYSFKMIGKNTQAFIEQSQGVLEKRRELSLDSKRLSKSEAYLSLTLKMEAQSADDIVEVYQEFALVSDLIQSL